MNHRKTSARAASLTAILLVGGAVALAGVPFVGHKAVAVPTPQGPDAVPQAAAPHLGGYSNSGCLSFDGDRDWDPSGICPDDDQFELTVSGSTLLVLHLNAEYNCCPADIEVSFELVGDLIVMTEVEIPGEPCDCDCCYNVESSVVDLAPGTYGIAYYWFDYYSWVVRCFEAQIVVPPAVGTPGEADGTDDAAAGETAAAAAAAKEIPPLSKAPVPYISAYSNTGCLWEQFWPCEEDDVVVFTPTSGALHAAHMNITYNCCLDDIVVSMTVVDDFISLTEEEVLTNPCYCICCYDFEATVAGLAPGTYTVEYCWYDYEEGPRCYTETVVIP